MKQICSSCNKKCCYYYKCYDQHRYESFENDDDDEKTFCVNLQINFSHIMYVFFFNHKHT